MVVWLIYHQSNFRQFPYASENISCLLSVSFTGPSSACIRITLHLGDREQILGDPAFVIIRSVSLKILNMDHLIVNGDVQVFDMQNVP